MKRESKAQLLHRRINRVENASRDLMAAARNFAPSQYTYHDMLHRAAREYAAAVRALARAKP